VRRLHSLHLAFYATGAPIARRESPRRAARPSGLCWLLVARNDAILHSASRSGSPRRLEVASSSKPTFVNRPRGPSQQCLSSRPFCLFGVSQSSSRKLASGAGNENADPERQSSCRTKVSLGRLVLGVRRECAPKLPIYLKYPIETLSSPSHQAASPVHPSPSLREPIDPSPFRWRPRSDRVRQHRTGSTDGIPRVG
jgi:hypothetical protein